MNLFCYIPLATGQNISYASYSSLSQQTVKVDVIPCCTPGVIESQKNTSIEKLVGEMNSRNLALNLMLGSPALFSLMQDRDCIHIYDSNYQEALEYMTANPKVGILSLPWKNYEVKDHIIMRAMVIRTEAVKNFRFRIDQRNHMCKTMVDDLINSGWGCEFLPSGRKLINELWEKK